MESDQPRPRPTDEQWRAAHEAARAYVKQAPWEWMADQDMFGVRHPTRNLVGYCCVLGAGGEEFGLIVYRGSEGLGGLYRMLGMVAEGLLEPDPMEMLLDQDCLAFNLYDRDEVPDEQIAMIKRLGLRYRGANAWPVFTSYVPGYVPSPPDADEMEWLTAALREAVIVAERFREDPDVLPGLQETDAFLVRVPPSGDGGKPWQDAVLAPDPPPTEERAVEQVVTLGRDDARRLRALPQSRKAVELDTIPLPMPMPAGSDDERQPLACMAVLADAANGAALELGLVDLRRIGVDLANMLVRHIEGTGKRPAKVCVQRRIIERCAAPLCEALGIRLQLQEGLRSMDALMEDLAREEGAAALYERFR